MSLDTQEQACREYCRAKGWTVAAVYREAQSGTTADDRPEFQAALTYCVQNSKQVAALVVYSTLRFARNTQNHLHVRTVLLKCGVLLRSCLEPLGETAADEYLETALSANNTYLSKLIGERTAVGMRAAAQIGRWQWKRPVGYRTRPAGKLEANIEPDPDIAPLVRKAFELVAEGLPKYKALETVTALGLRGESGKPLSLQSFDKLLENELYAGWVVSPKLGIRARGSFDFATQNWPTLII